MPNFLVHIFNTLKQYDLLLALVFVLAYWLLKRFISTTVINLAQVKSVATTRTMFITRCFNIFSFILLFATYIIVSGIGYGNFTIFISSLVTVLVSPSSPNGQF